MIMQTVTTDCKDINLEVHSKSIVIMGGALYFAREPNQRDISALVATINWAYMRGQKDIQNKIKQVLSI